uniref:non-specific serine/threonine protein kinase n=1 Tax=Oryza meridionalis TaxID=40149 RepID=A0A0E0CBD1_9ORYZ
MATCRFSSCVLCMIVLILSIHENPLRAVDTLTANQPLSGDQKLISQEGKFALGFFQPAAGGSSGKWYIGIWYNKIPVQTVVWVANRDTPIYDIASSNLTISADGNLVKHLKIPVKLSRNKVTGVINHLISWKEPSDPAPGMFSLQMDPSGANQYTLLWNNSIEYWASGNWTGDSFTGVPEMSPASTYPNSAYTFQFIDNDQVSFMYNVTDDAL